MSKADVDKNEMSRLVKAAMGDRTYREYASDSGVDAAIISKIINKKYTPGVSILQKLSSDEAKPQNGVTFDSFMGAYKKKNNVKGIRANTIIGISSFFSVLSALITPGALPAQIINMIFAQKFFYDSPQGAEALLGDDEILDDSDLEEYKKYAARFKAISIMIIADECRKQEINITSLLPSNIESLSPESLHIECGLIKEWRLIFVPGQKESETSKERNGELINQMMQAIISPLFFKKERTDLKETIVTDDKELFSVAKDLANNISYLGNLSVILIDCENMKFVEECILSSYPGMEDSIAKLTSN